VNRTTVRINSPARSARKRSRPRLATPTRHLSSPIPFTHQARRDRQEGSLVGRPGFDEPSGVPPTRSRLLTAHHKRPAHVRLARPCPGKGTRPTGVDVSIHGVP
jgi:hypothetical protein